MNFEVLESFLFHPRKAYEEFGEKDQLIEVENDVKIGARFYLQIPVGQTILFFHGNGEIAPEYDDIAAVYNKRGFNFIVADYRGYGFSNGAPNKENTQRDAHVVLDFVIRYLKVENYSRHLILMGRSLGSVSVLELTQHYPEKFSALIIESGFADEEPLFQLFEIKPEQVGFKKEYGFLNGDKIANYKGPLLVIHAEEDQIVPFSQGEELMNLCPSENKKLVPIPNANHNNILGVNPQMYFEEVTQFINSVE